MRTTERSRVPAGVSAGGQYAPEHHDEADVTLDDAAPRLTRTLLVHRASELEALGFLPATAVQPAQRVGSTRDPGRWWVEHAATAELHADASGHVTMPEDYTPARTAGRAHSGLRRTTRRTYRGAGTTLMMPSAAAIARFSSENDDATFDVPISATVDGRSLSGWARVRRQRSGQWTVTPLGFPDAHHGAVGEAVASVLEARRPTMALTQAGDLIGKHRERLANQGADMAAVTSAWVAAVGYDPSTGVMATRTITGRTYGHRVDPGTFEQVKAAHSPGRAFNQLVKGRPGAQVEHCPGCGRFYSAARAHTCPGGHSPAPTTPQESNRALVEVLGQLADHARSHAPHEPATPATASLPRPVVAVGPPPPAHVRDPAEKTIDAAALVHADLDRASARRAGPGPFGPRGWTAPHITGVLAPKTSSTYVPWAYFRDPRGTYALTNGDGGMYRYSGLDATEAAALLARLPDAALQDAQNDAPSLRALLTAAATHPGRVEVHGYAVGPGRDDERITAEGIYLFDDTITSSRDAWEAARTRYGLDDAAAGPDEAVLGEVPWRPGEKAWRLWWD